MPRFEQWLLEYLIATREFVIKPDFTRPFSGLGMQSWQFPVDRQSKRKRIVLKYYIWMGIR
jgi:hypothetical protein